MVATNNLLDKAKTQSINLFDAISHIAFGDSDTSPLASNSSINNELLRKTVFSSVKDLGNYTYEFTGLIPITQLNSQTVKEVGFFNSSSGGNLFAHAILPTSTSKTSDDELVVTLKIKTTANNS